MAYEKRDWNDPQYKNWRRSVRKRDGFKCRMPGCESTKRLQTHHIKTWASAPGLRYEISNGITLCYHCHKSIKNKERENEHLFHKILEWDMIGKIKSYDRVSEKINKFMQDKKNERE